MTSNSLQAAVLPHAHRGAVHPDVDHALGRPIVSVTRRPLQSRAIRRSGGRAGRVLPGTAGARSRGHQHVGGGAPARPWSAHETGTSMPSQSASSNSARKSAAGAGESRAGSAAASSESAMAELTSPPSAASWIGARHERRVIGSADPVSDGSCQLGRGPVRPSGIPGLRFQHGGAGYRLGRRPERRDCRARSRSREQPPARVHDHSAAPIRNGAPRFRSPRRARCRAPRSERERPERDEHAADPHRAARCSGRRAARGRAPSQPRGREGRDAATSASRRARAARGGPRRTGAARAASTPRSRRHEQATITAHKDRRADSAIAPMVGITPIRRIRSSGPSGVFRLPGVPRTRRPVAAGSSSFCATAKRCATVLMVVRQPRATVEDDAAVLGRNGRAPLRRAASQTSSILVHGGGRILPAARCQRAHQQVEPARMRGERLRMAREIHRARLRRRAWLRAARPAAPGSPTRRRGSSRCARSARAEADHVEDVLADRRSGTLCTSVLWTCER